MKWKSSQFRTIAFKFLFGLLLAGATHQSLVPRYITALESFSDQYLHVVCWGTVAIAMHFAFPTIHPKWPPYLLLFGYSIAIEFGQILVPGRFFSGVDIIANGLGCGIGLIFCLLWCRQRQA